MKIALLGYGKMGRTIEPLALAAGHEIVLKIGSQNTRDLTAESIKKADVAIEFSLPETAFENIQLCLKNGVAVVSGTTAWLDRLPEAKTLVDQHKGAFLYASNFSIGVNIFFAVNRFLAKRMAEHRQYTVALEEIHHTQKLDAPSGTAITLAEGIIDQFPDKERWVNRASSDSGVVPVISKRIDTVPGTHEVTYESNVDQISIRHVAHSREGFASGALHAAEWIVGKQGFFTMDDFLGIK